MIEINPTKLKNITIKITLKKANKIKNIIHKLRENIIISNNVIILNYNI